MPRPTCQLNLTLDVPTAEWVERIAMDNHLRPSGTGRTLLLERLELEKAGWKLQDEEMADLLKAVASLNERGRQEVRQIVKNPLLRD